MRCWRVDIQRNFSRYLDHEVDPGTINRMEAHLLDCQWCRSRLARLRDGHRFARGMPRIELERDPWDAIEAAIETGPSHVVGGSAPVEPARVRWRGLFVKPEFVAGLLVMVLLLLGALFVTSRHILEGERTEAVNVTGIVDLDEFHAVNIADMERNTQPHVVAEGYVSEVRFDRDDGDLTFKLVENLEETGPFVVCEIISPIRIEPPAVGSRVRVYGVSRYDGQENHQWYEVHPVLGIEQVHH